MTTRIISTALLMMLISVPAFPRDVNSELIDATLRGQTERVKSLLAAGADVDATDNDGITALMSAVYARDTQTVKVLLDAGADLEASNEGHTALRAAVIAGEIEVVQALLDAGADVDAKANDGVTALILAGETEIVQALVEAGADVNAKTNDGMSALIYAEAAGHTEIAELLKSAGANWGQEEIDLVTQLRRPENILLANELSAVSTVKDIVVAQINYSATDGEGEYAKNLPELTEAGLIASELATGMQNGYQFATSSEGETFTVNADPIMRGETGTRHLFADESGVIRWSMEGPATVFNPGFGESQSLHHEP